MVSVNYNYFSLQGKYPLHRGQRSGMHRRPEHQTELYSSGTQITPNKLSYHFFVAGKISSQSVKHYNMRPRGPFPRYTIMYTKFIPRVQLFDLKTKILFPKPLYAAQCRPNKGNVKQIASFRGQHPGMMQTYPGPEQYPELYPSCT